MATAGMIEVEMNLASGAASQYPTRTPASKTTKNAQPTPMS
jgi:hypothetical protein